MARRSRCSGSRWFATGIACCRGAAKTAAYLGTACGGSLTAGCPLPASIIPIPCAASALSPEARAGCGKSARPDLLRGLWATMIPTQTTEQRVVQHARRSQRDHLTVKTLTEIAVRLRIISTSLLSILGFISFGVLIGFL